MMRCIVVVAVIHTKFFFYKNVGNCNKAYKSKQLEYCFKYFPWPSQPSRRGNWDLAWQKNIFEIYNPSYVLLHSFLFIDIKSHCPHSPANAQSFSDNVCFTFMQHENHNLCAFFYSSSATRVALTVPTLWMR